MANDKSTATSGIPFNTLQNSSPYYANALNQVVEGITACPPPVRPNSSIFTATVPRTTEDNRDPNPTAWGLRLP